MTTVQWGWREPERHNERTDPWEKEETPGPSQGSLGDPESDKGDYKLTETGHSLPSVFFGRLFKERNRKKE